MNGIIKTNEMDKEELLEVQIKTCWINAAVKDCYNALTDNKNADSYETKAGDLVSIDNEVFQLKIIVTRKESEFLGNFGTVEHVTFQK